MEAMETPFATCDMLEGMYIAIVYRSRSEYLISSEEKHGRPFSLSCSLRRSSSKMKEGCVFATYDDKFFKHKNSIQLGAETCSEPLR